MGNFSRNQTVMLPEREDALFPQSGKRSHHVQTVSRIWILPVLLPLQSRESFTPDLASRWERFREHPDPLWEGVLGQEGVRVPRFLVFWYRFFRRHSSSDIYRYREHALMMEILLHGARELHRDRSRCHLHHSDHGVRGSRDRRFCIVRESHPSHSGYHTSHRYILTFRPILSY